MSNIYLHYTRLTYTTRNPYTNDRWDCGDTKSDIEFHGISFETPSDKSSMNYESIESSSDFVKGEEGFAVVVTYDTGSSFGFDENYFVELIDVFKTLQEADKVLKSIEDDSYTGYKPWKGYFERLSSVQIISGVL